MAKKMKKVNGSTKASLEKPHVTMPQTLEEAAALLAKLGTLQRQAKAIADQIDAEVTSIRELGDKALKPVHLMIAEFFTHLRSYANVRRNELTENGKKKSIRLATGEMSWRKTPPKVKLEDEAVVLAAIEKLGLEEFIRRPAPEIDRDALKKNPDKARTIPGVNVVQTEEFRVKPESGTGELSAAMVDKIFKTEI